MDIYSDFRLSCFFLILQKYLLIYFVLIEYWNDIFDQLFQIDFKYSKTYETIDLDYCWHHTSVVYAGLWSK